MTRYGIRYKPGTTLAARYPSGVHPKIPFSTREWAEEIRRACVNADQMEVFEVEDDA